MAVSLLRRLAAGMPVPVFAVAGAGARRAVQDLRLRPEIELVASPRHASVLLAAGGLPTPLLEPVARVHDQMPAPRATVWWTRRLPGMHADVLAQADIVRATDPSVVVAALVDAHAETLTGRTDGEPTLLPHRPPAPWEGIGPHGQGGEGMMGGRPYGRPMAMTGPDLRDGLELDRVPLRVGPFLPGFPPGLVLDVELQGDVVQEAGVGDNPFLRETAGAGLDSSGDEEVPGSYGSWPAAVPAREIPVAEIETARARHHLRWAADVLHLHGLTALSRRVLRRAAGMQRDDVREMRRLRATLVRNPSLRWAMEGVGRVDADAAELGPAARAAGAHIDARLHDPAYDDLGFVPISHDAGDAWDRFRQRLAEAVQAVELAARAGDVETDTGAYEGPRGPADAPGPRAVVLEDVLPGLEWGDAVATVASLDIDLEAHARTARTEQVGS